MSGWTTIWVFLIAAGASGAVWVTTPKGPNQVLIRTSVTIALTCMYLMWFIIYMAQLHPIVSKYQSFSRIEDDDLVLRLTTADVVLNFDYSAPAAAQNQSEATFDS
ncbi:hypothetical protein NDA18_002805 [Ustilago nuda]|nr:hypothetical protein NDA18_002805 [Ustilago nuda]